MCSLHPPPDISGRKTANKRGKNQTNGEKKEMKETKDEKKDGKR
jgi:hypothetical protein